jgi:integrase
LRVGSSELKDGEQRGRSPDGRVRAEDVPTVSDVRKLLVQASPGPQRALFLTQALTGVRTGELFALQWTDLDWQNEVIAIRRSVSWARIKSEGEPVRFRFYPPKTASGVRDLPFPKELQRVLKAWKLQCPPNSHDLDLVFPADSGAPLHRSKVLRYGLYPACRRAELRQFKMKAL